MVCKHRWLIFVSCAMLCLASCTGIGSNGDTDKRGPLLGEELSAEGSKSKESGNSGMGADEERMEEKMVWLSVDELDFAMLVPEDMENVVVKGSDFHVIFQGENDSMSVTLRLWDQVSRPDEESLAELVSKVTGEGAAVIERNGRKLVKVDWPHGEVNYYILGADGDAYSLWITPYVMKDPEVYGKVRAMEESFCGQSGISREQAQSEAGQQDQAEGKDRQQDPTASEKGQQSQTERGVGQQKVVHIKVPQRAQIDYLVLVNSKTSLPDGWEENLDLVYTVNSVGDMVPVERTAYKAYLELQAELEKEGIELDLDSAYRSVEYQQDIMDRFTEKYGEAYARRTVATPGYSEHHTGLALDLYFQVNGEEVYENEDLVQYPEVWKRIHAHLADHGFILRYPNWKNGEVDYTYEPWHIRYVGREAAEEIMAMTGKTFEEWLEKLKN